MKNVMVTGCAGFIGSHTVEALLARGDTVMGIDNFGPYYAAQQKERNIQAFQNHQRFRLVRADLNETDLAPLLRNVQYVIHLAAQPGVRKSWEDFTAYVKDNILATQRLLAACDHLRIKKFVYASSSSVYGDAALPFTEDCLPRPVSPYGITKLAAEQLVLAYHKNYGLPAIALRYFTVYGPRQRPDMAFHQFIRSLLEGKEVIVFGDGTQTRDVTYISDVVNANLLATDSEATGVYNIGGGSRISINEVLGLLEELTGTHAIIKREGTQKGDVDHTEADMHKAHALLGYRPRASIRYGMHKEIDWVKGVVGVNEIA